MMALCISSPTTPVEWTRTIGRSLLKSAIEAATASGPATLGPQAPHTGRLEVGFDADVITLDANPLDDRSVWGDPDRVQAVWQLGRRAK